MVVMDHPQRWPKYGLCAHLISTKPGADGTAELLAFGHRIGLKPQWLQKRGDATEHFDVMRGAIDRAREAGAVVLDRNEFVAHIRAKRSAA
jgi:hypothetical protein